MIAIEHGSTIYCHEAHDPTSICIAETKKAKKRVVVEAREERKTMIMEARNMLKTQADASLGLPSAAMESNKAKLLEDLSKATYRLSWSVSKARSRKNNNALRNLRQRRSNMKKLHAQLSNDNLETDVVIT